jgi:hypothetical protein
LRESKTGKDLTMLEILVKSTIDAPALDVWEVIDDFGAAQNYHPLVAASPLLGEQRSGEGAERCCEFHGGGKIYERITAYEKGVGYEVTITDTGPFPLKTAIGELRVTPVGDRQSEVSFGMRFIPNFGPIGWLMGQFVMKSQFRKTLRQVLGGLDEHVRTGRVVGPDRSGGTMENASASRSAA